MPLGDSVFGSLDTRRWSQKVYRILQYFGPFCARSVDVRYQEDASDSMIFCITKCI